MDMRDIAKIAGVSSATVSRVINNSSLVRPATAEKVRKVIQELKFVPNGSATTLKYGKSSSYGPDYSGHYESVFSGVYSQLRVDSGEEQSGHVDGDYGPACVEDAADDPPDAGAAGGWGGAAGVGD